MKKLSLLKDQLSQYGVCDKDQCQLKGGRKAITSFSQSYNNYNTTPPTNGGGGFPPRLPNAVLQVK